MDALQQSFNQAVEQLPALFIERLVSKKLREQGIKASKRLSERIAKYVLSDKSEPFRYKGHKHSGDVTLSFSEGDADEVVRALETFCETQLPRIIPEVSSRLARTVLADLKIRWKNEYTQQSADSSEFRKRLEDRWGAPLGKLRMLLTMSREWCQEAACPRDLQGKAEENAPMDFDSNASSRVSSDR